MVTNLIMLMTLLTLMQLASVATADNRNSPSESNEAVLASGLVYATEMSDGCRLGFFDPKTASLTTLAIVPECSGSLYVPSSYDTAYYVLGSNLYYVDLTAEEMQPHKMSLPDDDFELYRASLDVKPSDHYYPPSKANRLKPFWVGSLNDGRIAVAMIISVATPADSYYTYLFVRNSNQWDIEDQKRCGGWDACNPEKIEAERTEWLSDYNERDIWSVDSTNNTYLTSAEFANIPGKYDSYIAERKLRFKVNNSTVFVKVRGGHSQHGMGIYTYTVHIEFDGLEKNVIDLSACDVSFFDRYLLVHPCRGPGDGQVYDLETGAIVLDSLLHFGWFN